MAAFIKKMNFLRSLMGKEYAYNGPFHVTIDVTRRCNLNCIGCRYHSQAIENIQSPGNQEVQDINPLLFKKLCRELAALGTTAIELSGEGEPLVNKNLFNLISIAKENNLNVTVCSNGTLFDSQNIESLINSQLDRLKVSLWGCTQETYEGNYPGTDPKWFDRVIDGLNSLALTKRKKGSSKPAVVIHHPINRINFRTLDTLVDLVQKTGCNGISFSPLKARRAALAPVSLHADEEGEVLSSLSRIKKRLDSLGLKHNIEETIRRYEMGESVWQKLPCYIGFMTARMKVDGTVVPCNPYNLPMGNLNKNSFQEIWNNDAYKEFRQQTSTRQGLAAIEPHCDCGYCCFLNDNWRVHRIFKWIAPLTT
jgi:radical SAM protein with 4Fe4S-binding SPASM domain